MGEDKDTRMYTLFSVTKETFEKRIKRIRELAKTEPILAFLVTVFNFEWTVRRAVVAMSPCPTAVIHKHFNDKHCSGWKAYCNAWTKYVIERRNRIQDETIPQLTEILMEGRGNNVNRPIDFQNLEKYLMVRNKLVHGVVGSAPAKDIDEGLEVILKASEIITQYVEDHAEKGLFQMIRRMISRCASCPSRGQCPLQKERDEVRKHQAKRQNAGEANP